MKMLGQDVHTQEEFDAFKKEEFDPLRKEVEMLKYKIKVLFGAVVIIALTSVVLALR